MVTGMKINAISARVAYTATIAAVMLVLAGCDAGGPDDRHPVQVGVSTDYEVAVPGQSITLVWRFKLAPDWHLYWIGRNDSGFAPTIDLDLPKGWIAGGLQWPAPERHLSEGDILDHVYRDELVLLQKIGVPASSSIPGQVDLTGRIQWLACKDSCVPGKDVVELTIKQSVGRRGHRSAAYTAAHDQVPRPLPSGLLTTRWQGGTFHVSGPAGTQLQFMPTVDCGELVNLIRDGLGSDLALRFQAREGTVGPVRGLIIIEEKGEPNRAYTVDFPARLLRSEPTGG